MTDEQANKMFDHLDADPDVIKAAGAYGALLKLLDTRLPQGDKWLLDALDEAVGASLATHAQAAARWGLAQAQGGAV